LDNDNFLLKKSVQKRRAEKNSDRCTLIEAQAAWRNRVNTIKAEKPKIEFAD